MHFQNVINVAALLVSVAGAAFAWNANRISQQANQLSAKAFETGFEVQCNRLPNREMVVNNKILWMRNAASCEISNSSSRTITIDSVSGIAVGVSMDNPLHELWIRPYNDTPTYPEDVAASLATTATYSAIGLAIPQGQVATLKFDTYAYITSLTADNKAGLVKCSGDAELSCDATDKALKLWQDTVDNIDKPIQKAEFTITSSDGKSKKAQATYFDTFEGRDLEHRLSW